MLHALTSLTIPENAVPATAGARKPIVEGCDGLLTLNYNAMQLQGSSGNNNIIRTSGSQEGMTVNIGSNVTAIPEYFMGACKIKSITIPEGVTSISNNAFSYCSTLTKAGIPTTIETIGNNAFDGCAITDIYYAGSQSDWGQINIASSGKKPNCTFVKTI